MKTRLYKVHMTEQVNGETFGFTMEYSATSIHRAKVMAYKEFDSSTFNVLDVKVCTHG